MDKQWRASLRNFRAYLKLERGMSDHTVAAYVRDLRKVPQFLALHELELSPAQLERRHLEDFLAYLHGLGLGERSQARQLSALKTYYRYLIMEELATKDPTELLRGPKISRAIPEVLTYEEVQRMLAAVDLSTDAGVRDRAILETLYACGLRVSELTGLQLTNLHLEVGWIRIIGKGDKERLIPIGEEAIKHLRLYLEGVRRRMLNIEAESDDIVFLHRRGGRLSRISVFNMVKKVAAAAGIQKTVSPHTFRHSFATHLIEGGADLKAVQDMLGHESIITTEIYTHLDTSYLRDTILTFHPRNNGGKNFGDEEE